MDDALLVRCFERLRDLLRDRQRLIELDRTAAGALRQVLALDQLHHKRLHPRRSFEAIDRRDVGMIQRRERLRFPLEAGEALDVAGKAVRQDFDRHLAAEARVDRAIHRAHSTFAKLGQDRVRADLLADHYAVLSWPRWTHRGSRITARASGGGPPSPIDAVTP